MSSATSDVTYTSVYTDSEPGRAFWGADYEEISEGDIPRVIVLGYDGLPLQPVAPPSPDYILGPENLQILPVPQDEDEREPMFIQAHWTPGIRARSVGGSGWSKEDDETEDGPVDYPMDGGDDGDDDDGDSSGDDARDEDKDEEDDEDEEEEEEHLAPADSTVVPADGPVFPPEGTEPIIPPPSTDITIGARITIRPQTSISLPPEAELRDFWHDYSITIPQSHISNKPSAGGQLLLGCMATTCTFTTLPPHTGVSKPKNQGTQDSIHSFFIDAVTAALPPPSLPPLPPSLSIPSPIDRRDDIPESEQPPRKRLHLSTIRSKYEIGEADRGLRVVGFGIKDTLVESGQRLEFQNRHYDRGRGDRYGWWRRRLFFPRGLGSSIGWSQQPHQDFRPHRDHVYAHETYLQAHQTQLQLQSTLIQTQHQAPGPDGRDSPSHQRYEARDEWRIARQSGLEGPGVVTHALSSGG
ncbi:hypothetical protein Tco_0908812 [Tanacetum coccineum]|uniref:Uncharacterized protein n=1 Tax=Tanacetum coccineum TaxID=301880 RepID=A0ABQ5CQB1_9ASTR